jgi:hypothetical protein
MVVVADTSPGGAGAGRAHAAVAAESVNAAIARVQCVTP